MFSFLIHFSRFIFPGRHSSPFPLFPLCFILFLSPPSFNFLPSPHFSIISPPVSPYTLIPQISPRSLHFLIIPLLRISHTLIVPFLKFPGVLSIYVLFRLSFLSPFHFLFLLFLRISVSYEKHILSIVQFFKFLYVFYYLRSPVSFVPFSSSSFHIFQLFTSTFPFHITSTDFPLFIPFNYSALSQYLLSPISLLHFIPYYISFTSSQSHCNKRILSFVEFSLIKIHPRPHSMRSLH